MTKPDASAKGKEGSTALGRRMDRIPRPLQSIAADHGTEGLIGINVKKPRSDPDSPLPLGEAG